MPGPLYERLQRNRKMVEDQILIYLTPHHAQQESTSYTTSPINTGIPIPQDFDYAALIAQLDAARDKAHDITRTTIPNKEDGSITIIRDARTASDPDGESKHSFMMQMANVARAAELCVELFNPPCKNVHKQRIRTLLSVALRQMENGEDCVDKVKAFNEKIFEILEEYGVAKPEKRMKFAKEFVHLDDTAAHVVTITNGIGNTPLIEADIAALGLSDDLKREYETIATYSKQVKEGIISPLLPAWFRNLKRDDQLFVASYAGLIAQGNRVIPTQLIEHIVGLRNAYSKTVYVQQETGNLLTAMTSFHSGAPVLANRGKDESPCIDATVAILKLRNAFAAPERKVEFLSLNTPVLDASKDKESSIGRLLKIAIPRVPRATLAINAINKARMFAQGNLAGHQELLNSYTTKLGSDNTEIANFLRTGIISNIETFTQKLNSLKDDKALQYAIRLRVFMGVDKNIIGESAAEAYVREQGFMTNVVNRNLEMAIFSQLLSSTLGNDTPETSIFCKSGKDRTGVTMYLTTLIASIAATADVPKNSYDALEQPNGPATTLMKGQHTQCMASFGGTVGAHGVKMESFPAILNTLQGLFQKLFKPSEVITAIKGLFLDTAAFNKLKTHKDKDVDHKMELDYQFALAEATGILFKSELIDQGTALTDSIGKDTPPTISNDSKREIFLQQSLQASGMAPKMDLAEAIARFAAVDIIIQQATTDGQQTPQISMKQLEIFRNSLEFTDGKISQKSIDTIRDKAKELINPRAVTSEIGLR